MSIGRISPKTPVLFLSGRQDELVPPSHMDALFERCTSEKKVWNSFADGTHSKYPKSSLSRALAMKRAVNFTCLRGTPRITSSPIPFQTTLASK